MMQAKSPLRTPHDTSSNDCLAHLAPEQIETIYQRYLAGEPVSSLKIEFGIITGSRSLVWLLPPIERGDVPCTYCRQPMRQERRTRNRPEKSALWCPICNHHLETACNCDGCNESRMSAVMASLCARPEGVPIEEVTLRQAVLLVGFFFPNMWGMDWPVIPSDADQEWPFALTNHQYQSFVQELTEASLLRPASWSHPVSAEDYLATGNIAKLRLEPNVIASHGEWLRASVLQRRIIDRLRQKLYPNWEAEMINLADELGTEVFIYHLMQRCAARGIVLSVSPSQRELMLRLMLGMDEWSLVSIMECAVREVARPEHRNGSESPAEAVQRLWASIETAGLARIEPVPTSGPATWGSTRKERVGMAMVQILGLR